MAGIGGKRAGGWASVLAGPQTFVALAKQVLLSEPQLSFSKMKDLTQPAVFKLKAAAHLPVMKSTWLITANKMTKNIVRQGRAQAGAERRAGRGGKKERKCQRT